MTQIQRIILNDTYKPHTLEELRDLGISEFVLAGLDPENHYGVWFYNRRRIETWKDPLTHANRTKTTERPRQEWIAVPVPDIGVPRETVDASQERIQSNERPSRSLNRVWELDEGLLRCGQCGRTMVPRNIPDRHGEPRLYYICHSYSNKDIKCSGVRHHRAKGLESEVAGRLRAWVF